MKFAFLAHPLSQEYRSALAIDDDSGRLRRSWGGDIFQFCQQLHNNLKDVETRKSLMDDEIRVLDEFTGLTSATGVSCEGRFYEIPMDAMQILDQPNRALEFIENAVDDAADWGAEIVGLGSMTGIVGSHGQYIAERGPIAITTGNSLTVFSAKQNLLRACELTGIDLANETVAVIGIPGSIGTALAKLIAPLCRSLICVSRTDTPRARQLAKSIGARLSTDIGNSLNSARIVVSATSSGDCIDQNWLLPGSIVVDVAVPTDVIGSHSTRSDILILTGGMLLTPPTMSRDSMFIGFNHGMVPSCFGETMVLALENRRENYSIGRNLSVEGIESIGGVAMEHGFDFSRLTSFGIPLSSEKIATFQKSVYRTRSKKHLSSPKRDIDETQPKLKPKKPIELSPLAMDRHARFINPVLVALGKQSGFLKTFVKGEGCYLWDDKNRKYLDFVSGFGSLNLGHNHPSVTEAIRTAMSVRAPGFAQSAVNPYAAAVADRLISCSPPTLGMVSFANSGTEAVEAAIKLVRLSSSRKKILYCHGSYHGKTLGALSVTGNEKFQRPFGPLMDNMDAVDFGNLDQLSAALNSKQYAAFFVEPIQCEGGMNVPPPGYLNDVESLCQKTETLFVLDEIQTGLGRTGKLFCANHFEISPDIMTLAKSLGGGLTPVGAMICRQDLWLKAYGSVENFMLHTSTFAGGSLAMAAALATLDVLESTDLMENCAARSSQLLSSLKLVAESSDLIKDVRGQGLLVGIEFNPLPPNLVRHFAAHDSSGVSHFLAPKALDTVKNLAPIYVMQTLLDEHGIYTQIARSKPTVLRVQPPLGINEKQISKFVNAIEHACGELSFSNRVTNMMIAKSTFGDIDKGKNPVVPHPNS